MKEHHSSDQGSYEECEFTALNLGHIDETRARAKRKQMELPQLTGLAPMGKWTGAQAEGPCEWMDSMGLRRQAYIKG